MTEAGREPLVLGRYALHDVIASGGMATVHIARLIGPVGFSRTCAIKRLYPEYARDTEFVTMFLDEARVASRIRHANVVTTLDVVAAHGELFLVMDYVQGESLAALFARASKSGERTPLPVLVSLVVGALSGLHAAHEATGEGGEPLHIVHRDVSPQNILVDVDGTARVLDFGIAKAVNMLHETHGGQLKGKPAYMAPEQVKGERVDRRADVYAAAAVLWEGIAGRRLVNADNRVAMLRQTLDGEHDPPSKHAPGIPPELDALVAHALAPKPADRIATALDFATELERIVTPASPRQVAAWLRSVAGESLAQRHAVLRRVEATATGSSKIDAETLAAAMSADRAGRTEAPPDSGSLSGKSWARGVDVTSGSDVRLVNATQPPPATHAKNRAFYALVGFSATALVAAIAIAPRGHHASGDASFAPPPSDEARHEVSVPSHAPVTPALPAPSAPVTPVTPVTHATPSASADRAPNSAHAPIPPAPSASASAPNFCANPYVIDASGTRRIKPGCL